MIGQKEKAATTEVGSQTVEATKTATSVYHKHQPFYPREARIEDDIDRILQADELVGIW